MVLFLTRIEVLSCSSHRFASWSDYFVLLTLEKKCSTSCNGIGGFRIPDQGSHFYDKKV